MQTGVAPLDVAVVVASFNRAEPLRQLLKGLSQQNYPRDRWETLIVLDGSTDASTDLLEREQAQLPFTLRFFWQENAGQSVARDLGIRNTNARTIIIIDDDMELSPEFVTAHAALAEEHPETMIGIGRVVPREDWKRQPLHECVREDFMQRMHRQLANGACPNASAFVTQNVSFPRELYLQVGGFDPALRLDEDREMGIRLERAGGEFRFCSQGWAIHRSSVGGYEKWLARQKDYGGYAVAVWRKHNNDPLLHPLRNYVCGSRLNRAVVNLLGRTTFTARLGCQILRAAGETLRFFGAVGLGILSFRAIISLQYHQGVMMAWGGWSALQRQAAELERNPGRPQGPTLSGPTKS